jgi:cyanophycinase
MVARGQPGDVVILGLAGSDPDAEAVFRINGARSVTQLAVPSAAADLPATYAAIVAADIVWIRGGDQWAYIAAWRGTLTEEAIRDVYAAGGVVGGTSAGLHILTDVVFDARHGSLHPREALRDPYHPRIAFTDDFLNLTDGLLADSHFTERGRLARLAVLISRYRADTGFDVLGLGVDDRTALCVEPDFTATVRGEGAVTLLHRTMATTELLAAGAPPLVTGLRHVQVTEGYRVDLAARVVLDRPPTADAPGAPDFHPSVTDAWLDGSAADTPRLGETWADDHGRADALFLGALELTAGAAALCGMAVSSRTWNSFDYDENRVGGVQLALAANPHFLGLCLDGGVQVETAGPDRLMVRPAKGAESALLVLDGHGMASRAFSTYVSSEDSVGPRQSTALEDARLHLLPSPWRYDLQRHRPLPPLLPGDVDTDGALTDGDRIGLAAYLAGRWDAAGYDWQNADLDGDGRASALDLVLLARLLK